MYDPPVYLWAITIAGIIAIPALTCVVLYGGAERSATRCRGCRSRWPASWARCWRSAGSRWRRAPWRLRAW